jgi:DedD protein
MAFFKFRTRGSQGNEGRNASVAAAPAESVEAMRRRARHRLIGAAVLVLVGVIGFPLLFDTQPRPVSVDIPIEIPDRTKAKPLTLPATPTPAATRGNSGTNVATAPAASSNNGIITEAADGTEIPPGKPLTSAPVAEAKPEAAPEPKPQPKPEVKPEPKPEIKPKPETRAEAKPEHKPEPTKPEPKPAKPAPADDGGRARALLEGKPTVVATAKPAAASEENGRFVVQVGAFADPDKAKEVRQKLEKAGLKTYTHVAKTSDGERTRVRVGPFSTRSEADKAASKVKGLSLQASVLSL